MSFTLSYGNYSHDADEVVLRSIAKRTETSPRGRAMRQYETWEFEGILQASTKAALDSAITALEAAYAIQGQNLVFADSSHNLLSSRTFGGTLVTSLEWVNQFNAEYTLFRSYRISVEAMRLNFETELVDAGETLVTSGGLPDFRTITLRNGPPIVQMVSPQTPYLATQSGFTVGLTRPYPIPPPMFGTTSPPLKEMTIGQVTPEDWRGGKTNYRRDYTYQFEATYALIGVPRAL